MNSEIRKRMAFTKGVKGLDILAVGVDLAVCSVGSNDRLGCETKDASHDKIFVAGGGTLVGVPCGLGRAAASLLPLAVLLL
jgi:hypothetical protein